MSLYRTILANSVCLSKLFIHYVPASHLLKHAAVLNSQFFSNLNVIAIHKDFTFNVVFLHCGKIFALLVEGLLSGTSCLLEHEHVNEF